MRNEEALTKYLEQEAVDNTIHVVHRAIRSDKLDTTIAYRIMPYRGAVAPGRMQVQYAWARCSDDDQFARKTGRVLAKERLADFNLTHHMPIEGVPTTAKQWREMDARIVDALAISGEIA